MRYLSYIKQLSSGQAYFTFNAYIMVCLSSHQKSIHALMDADCDFFSTKHTKKWIAVFEAIECIFNAAVCWDVRIQT